MLSVTFYLTDALIDFFTTLSVTFYLTNALIDCFYNVKCHLLLKFVNVLNEEVPMLILRMS